MSLDDQIQDEELEPPTVCDQCARQLEATEPTIVGWRMLVFECMLCRQQFCSHLEGSSMACVDCTTPKKEE